jgi:transcriptional regulator with XRE-family HTH domain
MPAMTDQVALQRIARNLRKFREAKGLSMSALARLIDDYPSTIQRIEEAKNMPGVGLLTRLAEALDQSIEDFLEDSRVLSRAS